MSKRTHGVVGRLALAAALVGALGTAAGDATACGGEWGPAFLEREPDHRPRVIPLAEKALEEGRTVAAAGIVIRSMPHIRALKPTSAPIVERAERVLSLALARHGGALPIEREVPSYARGSWAGKTAADRELNLRWAVSSLGALHDAKKDDPALETDLAEAQSKLPELREEARERLERLAKRDLIGSAEGYAALAELRAEAGDAGGEKLALTRCRAMSKAKNACPARATESAS